jgi:hypothetical protein
VLVTAFGNDTDPVTGRRQSRFVPPVLSFSPTNWRVPQQMLLQPVSDNTLDPHAQNIVGVNFSLASTDAFFDEQVFSGTVLTVLDADEAGLSLSQPALAVKEGGSANFTVRLTSTPSSDVTLYAQTPSSCFAPTLAGGGDHGCYAVTNFSALPNRLVFSPQNWSTAQVPFAHRTACCPPPSRH